MASRPSHDPLPRPVVRFRPGGILGRFTPLPPMWLEGRLAAEYPDGKCALIHSSALELLVATVLSAQTTDERVNMVTPRLFVRYPAAAAYATADPQR